METALNTLNPTLNTPIRAYSYNIYDEVGRLKEVGELLTKSDIATHKVESQILYSTLPAFMEKGVRQQITRTYYDEQVFELEVNGVAFAQNNLRPRVASVTYSDRESSVNSSQSSANSLQYDRATHYSYDIHGNVKSLVQEIRSGGNPITNNFITNNYLAKRLDYDYDLISGKVNYVYYQKGQADQLSHRYTYDGDNRITQVHTSTDGTNWTRDAKYEYYAHGPLAKTELGAQNVETSVYAYTLQGWMKGMNGEHFSYALGFNDTDYKGIEAPNYGGQLVGLKETPIANNSLGSTGLYNGCITTWATNTPKLGEVDVASLTNQYQYDQLSRLRSSTVVNKGNQYKTSYQYDPNGNLTYLQRFTGLKDANNAAITAQLMDNFSYNYESKGAGYLFNTNKLRSVDDAITNTALHEEDLEDQNIDNYQYDDIGNLSKDNQEDIDKIEWTVYGMIKAVYRKAGSLKPNLVFEYDASGSRVSKISIDKTGTVSKTFYIRDASGNVMSTYTNTSISSLIALKEQYLYGSGRLGVLEEGNRSYELTDHLGNVRALVDEFKEVRTAYEYYTFGMSLAKIYNGYRYGFNGMENDVEFTGNYTTEFRGFDSRVGRWISVDPKQEYQQWQSPYVGINNNPIILTDPNGDIAPAVWAAIVYAMETGGETAIDIVLGATLTYLTGIPYTGWDIAADYATNLVPGWGEVKKVKKVAQITEAIGKIALKFHKIPGATKLLKEVTNGLDKFKETGDLGVLKNIRGKLYEVKLLNSLDNVVSAGSNVKDISVFSGLTKDIGESLNKAYGDVTFDIVQKTENGVLNLIEAKTSESVKGAMTLFGKTGIDGGDAKDLVKKLDFFADYTKKGGKGTLEFNFSEKVTDEFKADIMKFAEKRGIDKNSIKITSAE